MTERLGQANSVDRRRFLAGAGVAAAGLAAVAFAGNSASAANTASTGKAQAADSGMKHRLYRRGTFPRRSRWTAGSAQLVVTARHPIRSIAGGEIFTRDAVEIVFRQTKGKPLGQGLVTLTRPGKSEIPLFLTKLRPGVYGAVINRQEHTA
jgi:hypothetical protein